MSKPLTFSLIFVAFFLGIGFGFFFTPEYAGLALHGDAGMKKSSVEPLNDHRFLNMMISHHQKAWALAKAASEKSPRPEIKEFAGVVMGVKEKDINQLQSWKKDWFEDREKSKPPVYNLGPSDANFDLRFINALESKVLEAIEMAKDILVSSTMPDLLTWAGELIRTQTPVLKLIRDWRQAWYLAPLEVPSGL